MVKTPKVINAPCVTSDYLPTIVDALGIKAPKNQLDGTSILPLLQGKPIKRSAPIGFISSGQKAYNDSRYKLYKSGKKTELYDLLDDPSEKTNIAAQHPEIVKTLSTEFTQWLSTCEDSFKGKEYGTQSLKKVHQRWPGGPKK